MKQTIEIAQLPPGLNGDNGLMRMNHHKYSNIRDGWHWLIKAESPKKHPGRVKVRYTRVSTRKMDLDNVGASFKVIGDALESTGVIKNDSPDILTELSVNWKKAKSRKQQGIVIELEDA